MLLEVGTDFLVTAEDESEHNVVKLVQYQEAQQILVLGDAPQQRDYELKEVVHLEAFLQMEDVHDKVFHEVDDLGEAL